MVAHARLSDEFVAGVIAENPMHANFIRAALRVASAETREQLEDYLSYCSSIGLPLNYVVDCYNTITLDTQMEQIYFRKHKKYRWSRFSEVADKVYFNNDYMRKYMYGLAVTSFLWPNHTAIHRFFTETFPAGATGTYLEIGPGHGYYFMQAAQFGHFDKLIGVDISAASIALTQDIIRHFGIDKQRRVELVQTDFLSFDGASEPYSCIVMGEVLEHVEDPARFLRTIATISSPDTHIFVTTCVNAPAVDHIYLFRDLHEVEDMAGSNGLTVIRRFCGPYAGTTVEESAAQQLPINVAYVLKKA
ncbi:MAG: class I SAM-dependent methyltransferase [Methylobacteriaceae bacterium]|nr:class I SAM-dependent methyltransferase [Methylobacteriaceae bacterium]